jgi:hypothetical protein
MAIGDALAAYGLEQEIDPRTQFYRFSSQFAPETRAAFYGQEAPFTTRFQLRQPEYGGSFSQFLGAYPQSGTIPTTGAFAGGPAFTPYTGQELRTRAGGIAALQAMGEPAFAEYVTNPGAYGGAYGTELAGLTTPELAAYRSDYYTGGQAGQNVQSLANLLALQKEGGGQYTGRMQTAMSNMINELYTQYAAQNPTDPASFLNWYLQKSATGGRLAPGGYVPPAPAAG